MPADQLAVDRLERIRDVETPVFGSHLRKEHRFEQHISQLFRQTIPVAGVDRVVPIMKPYKLASAQFKHGERTVLDVAGRKIGGNSFAMKKPDPMGMRMLMDEARALPEETVLIGDSEVDVATARNAGTWVIGCTFGLSPLGLAANPPDVLVDAPQDWMAALDPVANGIRL